MRKYSLAENTINKADIESLKDWLSTNPQLTMDGKTIEFEKAWSKWLGVKYSVFVNSGSSANLLMWAALRRYPMTGIVPAVGWATTIMPAMQFGIDVIMCGPDKDNLGIDAQKLENELKQKQIDAVILVHVLGIPANIDAILNLQKQHGFTLIEDCCAAHGATHCGQKVGTFGDMSSFSFYYGHHMSTIEGGMVCTNNENYYYELLRLRSHGWQKDLPEHKRDDAMKAANFDDFHNPFLFSSEGFNVRSTDLQAVIGLRQLERLDNVVAIRTSNHLHYMHCLDGIVNFQHYALNDIPSSISFLAIAKSTEERKKIVLALDENNIETRIFSAGNLGRHLFWTKKYERFFDDVADNLFNCGFFLPNNQEMTTDDVSFVSSVVASSLKH